MREPNLGLQPLATLNTYSVPEVRNKLAKIMLLRTHISVSGDNPGYDPKPREQAGNLVWQVVLSAVKENERQREEVVRTRVGSEEELRFQIRG